MIDHYYSSWGERLEYVKIPGTETPVTFKYKENGSERKTINSVRIHLYASVCTYRVRTKMCYV